MTLRFNSFGWRSKHKEDFSGDFVANVQGLFGCSFGGTPNYAVGCHQTIPVNLGVAYNLSVASFFGSGANWLDGSSNGGDFSSVSLKFFEADGITPAPLGTPEPSTALLLAAGLGGILGSRRRRRCQTLQLARHPREADA